MNWPGLESVFFRPNAIFFAFSDPFAFRAELFLDNAAIISVSSLCASNGDYFAWLS